MSSPAPHGELPATRSELTHASDVFARVRTGSGLVLAARARTSARRLAGDHATDADAFALAAALTDRADRLARERALDDETWVWATRSFAAAHQRGQALFWPQLDAAHAVSAELSIRLGAVLPSLLRRFALALLDEHRSTRTCIGIALASGLPDSSEPRLRELATAALGAWVARLVAEPTIERRQVLVLAENAGSQALSDLRAEPPVLLAGATAAVEFRPMTDGASHLHVVAAVPVEVARYLRGLTDAHGDALVVASAPAEAGDDSVLYRHAVELTGFAPDPVTGRYDADARTALGASLRAALATARVLGARTVA